MSTKRRAWGIADQMANSITNFSIMVVAARNLDPQGFGEFAAILTVYYLLLALLRALTSDTMLATQSQTDLMALRPELARVQGAAITGAAVVGVVLTLSYVWSGSVLLLTVALCFPLLVAQDTRRMALIHVGHTRLALLSSLVLGFVALGGLGFASLLTVFSAPLILGCWAVGALIACIVAVGILPNPKLGLRWYRHHWRQGRYLLVEATSQSAAAQAGLLLVAATAGATVLGAIRAASLLLAPVTVLAQGIAVQFVSEGRRLERPTLRRFVTSIQLLFVAAGIAATAFWLAAPSDWTQIFLGDSANSAISVLIPVAVAVSLSSAAIPPSLGLRVTGHFRRAAGWRLALSPLLAFLPAVGAWQGGSHGAALGLALAAFMSGVVWTIVFMISVRPEVQLDAPDVRSP